VNLSPGTKVSVSIADIAFGGEGVTRIDDFVVFVPFVIVGEEVEVEITEVKKSFARAKLVRIIKASPLRVDPRCPYFGKCGGCQYQHITYDEQLRIKRKQISDLFQRVGGFAEALIAPVVPCPAPYGYRNRIMVRSQWNKPEQKLNIGFIRWDCGLVEDIEQCPISEPALNEELKRVRANPPPKGGLKVVLRIPPEDWEVPPDSFFQNNFFLLPKMVEVVRDRLRSANQVPATTRHLVDVYCGVGFFAIELAGLVESYAGVELDKRAIHAARKNAIQHRATNGEFVDGKAENLLPKLLSKFLPEKTSVILDPPRKGCAPSLLTTLREVRPSQIIYVSCHPATMARDLNVLCGDGVFELAQVVPLDMFPQTQHVECVADLRRK
jgi:23S rRNA (uracil1939-C5)-methyltransferase